MVYDRADRLVLEQNGVQKGKKCWTVYKYDGLGRLIYSFEHTDATPVTTLRERLKSVCAEERDSGTDNLGIGYTHTFDAQKKLELNRLEFKCLILQ